MQKILSLVLIIYLSLFVETIAQVPIRIGMDAFMFRPSSSIQSVGGSSVAYSVGDGFDLYGNPALVASRNSGGYMDSALFFRYSPTVWFKGSDEDTLNTFSLSVGYDFLKKANTPLRFALSHSILRYRSHITGKDYTLWADSRVTIMNLSASYSFPFMDVGIGINNRAYDENRWYDIQRVFWRDTLQGFASDFGIYTVFPLPQIRVGLFTFRPAITLGYMLKNSSDKNEFSTPMRARLPATENMGYSLQIGGNYPINDSDLRVIDITWTVEAQGNRAYFFERSTPVYVYDYDYRGAFSTINILDNIVLLKNNEIVKTMYGLRIDAANILWYAFGYHNPVVGAVDLPESESTFGFGVRAKGIFQVIQAFTPNSLTSFLARHFDIQYTAATIGTERQHYQSAYISLHNISF